MEQTLATVRESDAYFWATHAGAELDLLLVRGERRVGLEFKYSSAPTTTKSMHIALEDLKLEHLWVVYPGAVRYPLSEKITALPLQEIGSLEWGIE